MAQTYSMTFYRMAGEIFKRGGSVSAHQFQGAQIGGIIDISSVRERFPQGITVTKHRNARDNPLLTLRPDAPQDHACEGIVSVDDLRYANLEELMAKLPAGRYYELHRIKMPDQPGVRVGIVVHPKAQVPA